MTNEVDESKVFGIVSDEEWNRRMSGRSVAFTLPGRLAAQAAQREKRLQEQAQDPALPSNELPEETPSSIP